MVLANRTMRIGNRKWNHWVQVWTHKITMERPRGDAKYVITWQSGDDDNASLLVNDIETTTGDWVALALEASSMDGADAPDDEIEVRCGRYFIMFPFHNHELTDADQRQLQNLPPKPGILKKAKNAVMNLTRTKSPAV